MNKVGKTTRPFRHDINQIPYDYTVEGTNGFEGVDLIELSEELWKEIHKTVQEAVNKTIPNKKNFKKSERLCEETLHKAEKRTERHRRKGKIHPTECGVLKNNREIRKPS